MRIEYRGNHSLFLFLLLSFFGSGLVWLSSRGVWDAGHSVPPSLCRRSINPWQIFINPPSTPLLGDSFKKMGLKEALKAWVSWLFRENAK